MFRRECRQSDRDPEVFIDTKLNDSSYVDSFGLEWVEFDGYIGKEVMSHGHVFGRFMLPKDFFSRKTVVDVGCGNGRLGRLIAPLSSSYYGFDLSEAVYSFPRYIEKPEQFRLVRASGTDLPLSDDVSDVTICWGVLHHMDNPDQAFEELLRVTKPEGSILIFVYPKAFDVRKNLNAFIRGFSTDSQHKIINSLSDELDTWREIDNFFAQTLASYVGLSFKYSREWQKFQWFDGVTPRYHWSLESRVAELAASAGCSINSFRSGCYHIKKQPHNGFTA